MNKINTRKPILLTLFLLFIIVDTTLGQSMSDKKAVLTTLQKFEQVIIHNDSEAASNLLSDQIRILEGDGIETKEEYLSHHFHADGKFLSNMERQVTSQNVFIDGNIAWVTTQSRLQGSYNNKQLNLTALELAVLKKSGNEWKITALHWSSANRN